MDYKKIKFAIQTEGSDITYIADLYRYEEHGGTQIPVFSIITREASGTVSDIHDRMPLILNKDGLRDWIRPDGDHSAIVKKALTNMVFEMAVEYPRIPTDFITA